MPSELETRILWPIPLPTSGMTDSTAGVADAMLPVSRCSHRSAPSETCHARSNMPELDRDRTAAGLLSTVIS